MKINDLNLLPSTLKTLKETKKYHEFTLIQEKTIPLILKKENIIGVSPTGSGKSDAFLVGAFERINPQIEKLQILILAPTKELATQLYNKAKDYVNFNTDIVLKKVLTNNDKLKGKVPHILISTPKKSIESLSEYSYFKFDDLRMLVLDEIDMLLEKDFQQYIDDILNKTNKKTQKVCFGATLNKHIRSFSKKRISNSQIFDLTNYKEKTSKNVSHFVIEATKSKEEELLNLLKVIKPFVCLIFVNKKEKIEEIYDQLLKQNYNATTLYGGLDSNKRKSTLIKIEKGEFTYVVCSDLVARGIDLDNVSHVISLDLPRDLNFYFHRAGRTGRAQSKGDSFIIFSEKEKEKIKSLFDKNIKIDYAKIKKESLSIIKKYEFKKNIKKDEKLNKEILRNVPKSKNKKVKPNYKKKRKAKIEKIAKKYYRNKKKKEK